MAKKYHVLYGKVKVTFHRGNRYLRDDGEIDAEPFGTIEFPDELIERELIDKLCETVREHWRETNGEVCNIKIEAIEYDM